VGGGGGGGVYMESHSKGLLLRPENALFLPHLSHACLVPAFREPSLEGEPSARTLAPIKKIHVRSNRGSSWECQTGDKGAYVTGGMLAQLERDLRLLWAGFSYETKVKTAKTGHISAYGLFVILSGGLFV